MSDSETKAKVGNGYSVEAETSITRHHSQSLKEIRRKQDLLSPDNVKLFPSKEASRREGDYDVKTTQTHVIKIKQSADDRLLNQRVLQLFAGAGSGAITKTATAPLERVKILQQLQGMQANSISNPKYKGVVGTLRTVLQEEGFLALYKGNGANVLRVVPVYALKFTFNDTFRDMVKVNDEPLTFSRLILSGTLAGLFQTCITYPLETVRTRLTLGKGLGVEYNGIMDVFRQTIRTEGVGGLYKGIAPTFLTGSPYVGLQMTFYEVFKRNQPKLDDDKMILGQVYRLFCGALAGLIAQTITYPGDTVRRRMQTNGMKGQPKIYSSSIDCTKKIIRKEGTKALFNGYTANAVRCLPGAAIQFWAYDLLKSMLGA